MECVNCQGKGYINAYDHVAQGICFKCNGSGKTKDVTPGTKPKPVKWMYVFECVADGEWFAITESGTKKKAEEKAFARFKSYNRQVDLSTFRFKNKFKIG